MTSKRKPLIWLIAALLLLFPATVSSLANANEGVPGERVGTAFAFGQSSDNKTSIPAPPSGTNWAAFSAGQTHSLGLLSNGAVLGFGNAADNRIAIPALPTGQRYTAVSAGGRHSLLLTSAGTIRAIGSNSTNQLNVPTLAAGLRYTAVAAGDGFSVAVVSDGTLRSWGFDNYDQVSDVPSPQTGAKFTSVAAGNNHAIALQDNGQVRTWGRNTETQLQVPVPVVPTKYTAVDASGNRSMALRSDGQIFGAGEAVNGLKAPPAQGFDVFVDLAAGDDFGFGLTKSGVLVPFGNSAEGRHDVPFVIPSLQVTSIDAGAGHSLAILAFKPTVTIAPETNPVAYGDPTGVTVKVTAGGSTPTGNVSLTRSGNAIGSNTLSNGQRRFSVNPALLSIGSNYLYAEYAGDSRTVPGRATALNLTVEKAKPRVYFVLPNNATTGSRTSVTLRVEAGTASLEGSMTVKSGGRTLASSQMTMSDSGEIQVDLPRFGTPGTRQLTAEYGGSGFADPASASANLKVGKARSQVTLKLGKAKVKRGQRTKLSGQVTAGEAKAGGKVKVFQGKKKLRTLKINPKNGRFNLKLPGFSGKGKKTFRVEYLGTASVEKSKRSVALNVK